MATYLFCWELGTGRGHLTPHLPLANHLRDRGHEVIYAVRNLQHAETLLGRAGFRYVQAPTWIGSQEGASGPIRTYPQMLLNVGFGDPDLLVGRIKGWRELFELLGAQALVCDHSPTALLAARGQGLPAVAIGSGFMVPPLGSPMPALIGELDETTEADETRALANANVALDTMEGPRLDQLADILEVELRVLKTYQELDHYPDRGEALYVPTNDLVPGVTPEWPDAPGPKVFAYLKPGPVLVPLLTVLSRRKIPSLVCADGLPQQVIDQFSGPTLTFSRASFDMTAAGKRCDLAVLNANHGTLINLLLAGRPLLLAPVQLEQRVLTARLAELGVGVAVNAPKQTAVDLALEALLQDPRHRTAAQAFASRHAGFDFDASERELADRVEGLIKDGDGTAAGAQPTSRSLH